MKPVLTFALALTLAAGAFAADETVAPPPVSGAVPPQRPVSQADLKAKAAARADWFFTRIDSDRDGKISKAENRDFAEKMFEAADTDHDGFLSRDELATAKKREMQQWRAQQK